METIHTTSTAKSGLRLQDTASPQILERIARARELTRAYYGSDYRDKAGRRAILEALFGGLGDNVAVDAPIYCDHGDNIFIGDNVVIGMNCTFVDNERIDIGSNVLIASNVQIYTASHPLSPDERLDCDWRENGTTWFRTTIAPVRIGAGAWLGGGAIVLPGVNIGDGAVVAAGAVVTKDVPPRTLVAGVPARAVKSI